MDRAVLAAAEELLAARQYAGVVALCTDALEATGEGAPADEEPGVAAYQLALRVLRARAHIALRRDLDAQADLRELIRVAPRCAIAYRLLGVLAARRDENESAAIFFREALRLEPDDEEAVDWLQIAEAALRDGRRRAAGLPRPATEPAAVRFARGTHPPALDERPTQPYARGGGRAAPAPSIDVRAALAPALADGTEDEGGPPVARGSTRPARAPRASAALPEQPGFGEYLVEVGILTRPRLRAALAYQRSMNVRLSTAIVTLGLASPQRIEWAIVAHAQQLAR